MVNDSADHLVARTLRGDSAAFTALVEDLAPALRAFVAARATSAAMVDEVVQAAFVTAYTRLSTYRPGGSFAAWVTGIARNHLREELRRQQRTLDAGDLAASLLVEDGLLALERAEERAHEASRLRACLERLPASTQQLIAARYWQDQPLHELASRLRLPANRLAALLYRARNALLACLGAPS